MGPMVHRQYYFQNRIVTDMQGNGTNGSSILPAQVSALSGRFCINKTTTVQQRFHDIARFAHGSLLHSEALSRVAALMK